MTDEVERPGLDLLGSLLHFERIGRPGPAREQALEAAKADPSNAHVHLLDATLAALVGGEPRAARRLLADCHASAPHDEAWQRRIKACRAWAWTVDRLWYPGDDAAELASSEGQEFPGEGPADPETQWIEVVANFRFRLLKLRWQVKQRVRESAESAHAYLLAEGVGGQTEEVDEDSSSLAVRLAYGDLFNRAGSHDDANAALADVRQRHATLTAKGVTAPVALACTFFVEGDWHATPGSSPETLGFDLAGADVPSNFLGRRDLERAAAAYDQAEAHLAGVDEPRAHGALALRRAALAWLSGDHGAQLTYLQAAAAAFAEAGDAAAQWLTVVHTLLAKIAVGQVAATRRAAGMRFDLAARGPIAELLHWGENDGSVSWTSGLGRLVQRNAAYWDQDGDYPRAELAYELAVPLVPASGAEMPEKMLVELAQLDRRYGFGVRALTRIRAAVATLPPVTQASSEITRLGPQPHCLARCGSWPARRGSDSGRDAHRGARVGHRAMPGAARPAGRSPCRQLGRPRLRGDAPHERRVPRTDCGSAGRSR